MMEAQNTLNSGMCRCCSSEGTFKDIKTTYRWMGEEEVYAEMLTDCFDIKIQTPEDMDNGICELCITQLRNALNFKKQVLHTEEQFKRRMQGRDVKNPIKIESVEDSIESDHLSDQDFTEEYEVPIKVEIEEKPKAKKRPAKPATPRAKKAKSEPESSQHVALHTPAVKKEPLVTSRNKQPIIKSTSTPVTKAKPQKFQTLTAKGKSVVGKTKQNIEIMLRHSNATPTLGHRGIGYACFFCSAQFSDPPELKRHTLESHHDNKRDRTLPPVRFSTLAVKIDITHLRCTMCFIKYDQLTNLLQHLRVDHDQPVNTDTEKYLLPFRFNSNRLTCGVCDTEYTVFRKLLEHMNKHYRNYICDICDAGFVTRLSLRTHKRTHETGDYPCEQCPQVYNTIVHLKYHIRHTHLGQEKRHKCAYCGERFTCFIKKSKHLVEAHGVTPTLAKCKACDKTFRTKKALSEHYKVHHLMIKKHKCSVCDMAFSRGDALSHHMVKHTGDRNFKCEICQKAYGHESTLRQHLKIHRKDCKYKCEHCAKAFVQKCSLKSHLHSQHGVEMGK
ncbi:zinc finger protein 729-like isoform X6 [Leguminivora glycinivorella]|uniref:zinc finger protein 729-like isoform X6 n=1 Tax=Leguminivora glycinivorella TaxID=1035111 RepID=UPI00200C8BCE|nr:zinc finger protein 729-like isoform X6 [Leguminivora glycinivorella]